MTRVYYIKKTALENEKYKGAEKSLLEWSTATMTEHGEGSMNSILGRLLLRYALLFDHGIHDAVIEKTDAGKPYLRDHEDIYISISHTSSAVACAVSDVPVGLDVEAVTDKSYVRVIRHMFTENERIYADSSPLHFFKIWTMKESLVKLTGEGISRKLGEIDVLTGEKTNGAVFTPIDIEGTAACVCTEREDEVIATELTADELTASVQQNIH